MDKIKILFLAADPSNASRLRLGQELRDIREKLQLSKYRDKFVLESRESVRPGDISQIIFDTEPQVVHFSGHGISTGELCFEDTSGKVQPIKPDALAALFELVADQIQCVLLNACYSKVQAQAIAEHVPFVIGMSQAIGDQAAIIFSTGFYKALGAKRSFGEAYKFGCLEIKLNGISEDLTPVFISQSSNQYIKKKDIFNFRKSQSEKNDIFHKQIAPKYYVYLSDTKVNMLFPQLIGSLQEDKIDFHSISSDKYSKLNSIICKLNDEKMIGSLDDSLPYVGMKLRMKWGYLGWDDDSPITFWSCAFNDYVFALAGSKHHLLGQPANGSASSCSLTGAIVYWLLNKFGDPIDKIYGDSRNQHIDEDAINKAIDIAATTMKGQDNNFEFVAKVLRRDYLNKEPGGSKSKLIILATPLYVSLEE
ncbi:DUF7019 family protein [Tolypothrix sp. VBCCA 56010]|uniref:DUF7019 family protein n=1 Tax=Tolypothrix sp. VBCCA 56010 TaxID=3137731 RepID=UPI003D7D24F6